MGAHLLGRPPGLTLAPVTADTRVVQSRFARAPLRDDPVPCVVASALLPDVRSKAVELDRSLFDKEVVEIYQDYLATRNEPSTRLD